MFCFTYAGGTAAFFDLVEESLTGFELVKFEYAGHGTRHREPFYKSYDDLADDLYRLFKEQYLGQNYALFGYSMGAITAIEILKRILEDNTVNNPFHVFLAAHEPHTKAELVGYNEAEIDEWVKQRTIKFGAVPKKLLGNKSFWRMYLPVYRADYSIIGKYDFHRLTLQTDIPATVFYSEADTPRTEIELWQQYFVSNCEFHEFSGNHFFIQDHFREMAFIMNKKSYEQE